MAHPVKFRQVDTMLTPAKGDEKNVQSLPAQTTSKGYVSCWELSSEERNAVARTGHVWVSVANFPPSPIYVSGTPLSEDE